MLKQNDYIKYERKAKQILEQSNRNALQISKHYLTRWGKFERDIGSLDIYDKERATTLFKVIKELDPKERSFLASKYRIIIHGKNSISDKSLADEYSMDLKEYRDLRKLIEYKFFCILADVSPVIKRII